MRVDDVAHDAQADAGAAHLRVHRAAAAIERLEDVRQIVRVDAETAIGDANLAPAHRARLSHVDGRAARAVLHGVADEFCTADRSASASPDTGGSVPFECDSDA